MSGQIGIGRELEAPDDWDISTIEAHISDIGDGGTPDTDVSDYFGGNINWATVSDVKFKIDDTERHLTQEGLDNSSAKLWPEGSVIVTTGATIGKVGIAEEPTATKQGITGIVPKEDLDAQYFAYYLLSEKKTLQRYAQGGTFEEIRPYILKRLRIPVPPLPEQHRIVDILSKVDEQIQQTDEMIQSLRDLNDGLSQDVFDVQTTKEDADGEAEKEILRDFVEVISGTHVKSALVSADESKKPYITGPDDFENRGFRVTKYTDDPPSFCEPEDTLVTVKGSGCGASTFANQRAGISRQLKALRPTEQLDSRYLYYWIQTKEELLSILAQGTSIPGLSTTDLTTLQIPLPPLEQQEYIGEMFSTVDSRLDEEREQKQYLQELKRGLMQDLLTGNVRVDAD